MFSKLKKIKILQTVASIRVLVAFLYSSFRLTYSAVVTRWSDLPDVGFNCKVKGVKVFVRQPNSNNIKLLLVTRGLNGTNVENCRPF